MARILLLLFFAARTGVRFTSPTLFAKSVYTLFARLSNVFRFFAKFILSKHLITPDSTSYPLSLFYKNQKMTRLILRSVLQYTYDTRQNDKLYRTKSVRQYRLRRISPSNLHEQIQRYAYFFRLDRLCQTRIIRTLPKRRYFRAFRQMLL